MLVIDDLEITHLTVGANGKIDNAAGPQKLERCSDFCAIFRGHAINPAFANIRRPGSGLISYHPGLGYTLSIDAIHIQMPTNWQTTLDADDITTI